MTTTRRGTPICSSVAVTGFYHRLDGTPWRLRAPGGATYELCSLACLILLVTQPGPAWGLEARTFRAVGHAHAAAATGTG